MISHPPLRLTAYILLLLPLVLAQHQYPSLQDRYRSNRRHTGLIVGISIGIIVLLFFSSVIYAKFVSRRREGRRERTERGRRDEEFTITPLAAPVVAPPPYENPPSFEDATKRTQTISATSGPLREEYNGQNGIVG